MARSAAITYPAPLRAVAAAVHAGAALLCGAAYASTPKTKGRAPSPVWRGVAAAFAGWAIVAAVAPFPLEALPFKITRADAKLVVYGKDIGAGQAPPPPSYDNMD